MIASKRRVSYTFKGSGKDNPKSEDGSILIFNEELTVDLSKFAQQLSQMRNNLEFDRTKYNRALQELSSNHKPTFAIVTLLTRLAKKHSKDFNRDSIATLRTVARQVKMSPMEVLLNAKCFRFLRSSKSNGQACYHKPYGFRLQFAKKSRRGSKGTEAESTIPAVEQVVNALQGTLNVLEKEIRESEWESFIRIGRKTPKKQAEEVNFKIDKRSSSEFLTVKKLLEGDRRAEDCPMVGMTSGSVDSTGDGISSDDDESSTTGDGNKSNYRTKPSLQTHKMKSLDSLFWLHIQHRFICMMSVAIVFGNALGDHCPIRKAANFHPKYNPAWEVDYEPFLSFSFQLTARFSQRKAFLLWNCRMCLAFPDVVAIQGYSKDLVEMWDRRLEEGSNISNKFDSFLQEMANDSEDHFVTKMDQVFQQFQNAQPKNKRTKDCKPRERSKELAVASDSVVKHHLGGPDLADNEYWKAIQCATFREYVEFGTNKHLKKRLVNMFEERLKRKKMERVAVSLPRPVRRILGNKNETRCFMRKKRRRLPIRGRIGTKPRSRQQQEGDIASSSSSSSSFWTEEEVDDVRRSKRIRRTRVALETTKKNNKEDRSGDGSDSDSTIEVDDSDGTYYAEEKETQDHGKQGKTPSQEDEEEGCKGCDASDGSHCGRLSSQEHEGGEEETFIIPDDLPNVIDVGELLQEEFGGGNSRVSNYVEAQARTSPPEEAAAAAASGDIITGQDSNGTRLGRPSRTSGGGSFAKPICSIPKLRKDACRKTFLGFQLATLKDLESAGVDSKLCIKAPRMQYHLQLAPFEIYLANKLKFYKHVRVVNEPHNNVGTRRFPPSSVNVEIGREVVEHIDGANILHVCRWNSNIVRQCIEFPKLDIGELLAVLVGHGQVDDARGEGVRIHVGQAGPQSPTRPVGMGPSSPLHKQKKLRKMLGGWLSFIWECSNRMLERAGKPGLAEYEGSNEDFKRYFYITGKLGWQALTLCIQEIANYSSWNKEHVDAHNCTLPNSSYTGAANLCILDPATNKVYLLQMIANYRSQVTVSIFPFYKSVMGIVDHFQELIQLINCRIGEIYKGKGLLNKVPTALNRTHFFIDETLDYVVKDIGGGIMLEVLEQPIGFSRIFSASAMIHVLHRANTHLNRRQAAELCFVGTLLNTMVRFYHVMTSLLDKADRENMTFAKHPFDDWYKETTGTFNGKWQGGPYLRYGSVGIGDIGDHFGCNAKDGKGHERLDKVVDILLDLLGWVDEQEGKDEPHQLPIFEIRNRMKKSLVEIRKVAGEGFNNFGMFRLQMFLTFAIGCCLTKPGRHQRQVFFPVERMASYNHLKAPFKGQMSYEEANNLCSASSNTVSKQNSNGGEVVEDRQFDTVMRLVFEYFGLEVLFRDFMECGLCESVPARQLEKKEVLVKGVPMYDINGNGCIIQRVPGQLEDWHVVHLTW